MKHLPKNRCDKETLEKKVFPSSITFFFLVVVYRRLTTQHIFYESKIVSIQGGES